MSTYFRIFRSPSIRVNGVDIEPGRQDDSPFFGCRTYNVQGKTAGVPPEEWLPEAVRAAPSRHRNSPNSHGILWCRRRDLNPHGFPHHPLKQSYP